MTATIQQTPLPALFICKTFKILSNPEYAKIINWSEEGRSIKVFDLHALETKVLGAEFRHNNYHSFIRQLNMYGFKKERRSTSRICYFSHPLFFRENEENLHLIRKRKDILNPANSISREQARNSKEIEQRDGNSPQVAPYLECKRQGFTGTPQVKEECLDCFPQNGSQWRDYQFPLRNQLITTSQGSQLAIGNGRNQSGSIQGPPVSEGAIKRELRAQEGVKLESLGHELSLQTLLYRGQLRNIVAHNQELQVMSLVVPKALEQKGLRASSTDIESQSYASLSHQVDNRTRKGQGNKLQLVQTINHIISPTNLPVQRPRQYYPQPMIASIRPMTPVMYLQQPLYPGMYPCSSFPFQPVFCPQYMPYSSQNRNPQ